MSWDCNYGLSVLEIKELKVFLLNSGPYDCDIHPSLALKPRSGQSSGPTPFKSIIGILLIDRMLQKLECITVYPGLCRIVASREGNSWAKSARIQRTSQLEKEGTNHGRMGQQVDGAV